MVREIHPGTHFKELLETVCISTNTDKSEFAKHINILPQCLYNWQRNGVPRTKVFWVLQKLKEYCFERLGGLE